jgi:hypothetical protein
MKLLKLKNTGGLEFVMNLERMASFAMLDPQGNQTLEGCSAVSCGHETYYLDKESTQRIKLTLQSMDGSAYDLFLETLELTND